MMRAFRQVSEFWTQDLPRNSCCLRWRVAVQAEWGCSVIL
jgi:hypothetical protein